MPGRRDKFVNKGVYHIFNRTIDAKKLFSTAYLSKFFIEALEYYRSAKVDLSFSRYKTLTKPIQKQKQQQFSYRKYFQVDILGFCLMPTHFHLLVMQLSEGGIPKYMSNVLNSFTRYYNIHNKRKGPLFLPRFRSRQVISDEQFMHVSRYIYLNPYSTNLVDSFEKLENYPWSSNRFYINNEASFLINIEPVINLFSKDKIKYKSFVEDHADYQRSLEQAKYLENW